MRAEREFSPVLRDGGCSIRGRWAGHPAEGRLTRHTDDPACHDAAEMQVLGRSGAGNDGHGLGRFGADVGRGWQRRRSGTGGHVGPSADDSLLRLWRWWCRCRLYVKSIGGATSEPRLTSLWDIHPAIPTFLSDELVPCFRLDSTTTFAFTATRLFSRSGSRRRPHT